jgi:hypothetical protein
MVTLNEDRCGYRGRCCTMFERDRIGPDSANWPIAWSCDQSITDRVAACTAALSASSSYDPQQASQCARAIEAQAITPLCNGPDRYYGVPLPEETSPSCACLTAGVVDGGGSGCLTSEPPVGAPCGRNEDCAHDAYCAGSADGGMGICRHREQNGEACPAEGIGAMGAPGCRSEYCIQGICTPFCIGVR